MLRSWDVVVVGAGPSGTLAAERLEDNGNRVLLLDAGPRLRPRERTPEVDRRAWAYRALGKSFDWHRVRAVGGRALLWGGWSYRFPENTLRRAGWPYGTRTLAALYTQVERRIGVTEGLLDERYDRLAKALDIRIVPKRGALFSCTKVWTPLCHRVARAARTLTAALRFEHRSGYATALDVLDLRTGSTRRISARAFVLAASPVETTRILLESELGAFTHGIGQGLVDHMVASYLLIEPQRAPSPIGRGAFAGSALVQSFVNDSGRTERPYPGGFSIELSGGVSLESLGVERMVPGGESERFSATLIHSLGETFAHPRRYVDLDPTERDALGRRVPRIHLAWSKHDHTMALDMKRACLQIADAMAIPGSRLVPFHDPLLPAGTHEAGTCAMGREKSAPCDPFGRLGALKNVWIADASVMPTAGDRHPTLTLLAHSLRVADSVTKKNAGR